MVPLYNGYYGSRLEQPVQCFRGRKLDGCSVVEDTTIHELPIERTSYDKKATKQISTMLILDQGGELWEAYTSSFFASSSYLSSYNTCFIYTTSYNTGSYKFHLLLHYQ
jgi:hypothetical protein